MTDYSPLFHSVRGVSLQCFVDLMVWAKRNIPAERVKARGDTGIDRHGYLQSDSRNIHIASFDSVPEITMTDYGFLIGQRMDGRCLMFETPSWSVVMKLNTGITEVFMTDLTFRGDAVALRRDITALKLEGILE